MASRMFFVAAIAIIVYMGVEIYFLHAKNQALLKKATAAETMIELQNSMIEQGKINTQRYIKTQKRLEEQLAKKYEPPKVENQQKEQEVVSDMAKEVDAEIDEMRRCAELQKENIELKRLRDIFFK